MNTSVRRRIVTAARRCVAAAIILGITTISMSSPASAATITESVSISDASPTYNRVGVGSCALSGITAKYATIPFTTVGDDATTLNISVTASGFTPIVTLYQGAFIDSNANVNCYTLASNANINVGFGALPDPFESMQWILVIASDGANGSATATIESTNTGVEGPGGPPPDTTDPVLSLPGPMTVEATSAAGATVTYTATATDAAPPNPAVTCAPASGATFPLGPTTVNCSATDTAGNTANGSFPVTVVDTTAPALTIPSDITTEATSASGAVVTYAVSATDAVDPTPTIICSDPQSGQTFALGLTTVTCGASDDTGNAATLTFAVNVVDTTDPILTPPADQTVEATSPTGAVITYSASATDSVDASVAVVCTPASASTFPLGANPVSCTATDDAGNSATGGATMTVVDTTDPVLTVPADATVEATSAAGATFSFSATATDIADASVTVGCTASSGDLFPLGTTTVTCTATDNDGNTDIGSFDVMVVDTTAPTLSVPGDTFATATGPSGAVVTFTATAIDAVDPTPTVVCSPASGDTFPLGPTTVTCTATDDAGNESTDTFTVTVLDEGDPVLVLPSNITEEATGPTGATVTFEATATDDVDPTPEVVCTPASGTTFAIGDTTVTCTATDNDGNDTTGSFTVTVTDTSAPVLDLPDNISATATGPSGAVVTFTATATDLVAGDVPVQCTPPSGSTFPVGTTVVTCTATDAAGPESLARGFRFVEQVVGGNVATGTFTIVIAGLPPTTTSTTVAPTTTTPATTTTVAGPTTTAVLPTTGSSAGSVASVATIAVLLGSAFLGLAALLRFRRPN